MEAGPSTQPPDIESYYFLHRHVQLKSGSPARRSSSPDSACEQDGLTSGAASSGSGPDEIPSDMSEEGEKVDRPVNEAAVTRRPAGKVNQDSDVDSGIDACRTSGQRIGSTSSADTDSSQESRRQIDYSPPIQKSVLNKARGYTGSLRVPRSTSLHAPGPVKGDHTALKECNRRPPTPLTVFPDPHHCVRFDEQLPLSEQNLRRSCRKLFATLYAFSYQGKPDSTFLHERPYSGSTRIRSRTLPEIELRRCSPATCPGTKENLAPSEARRSSAYTPNPRTALKSIPDVIVNGRITPPHLQNHKFLLRNRLSMDLYEGGTSNSNSTDSGLGSLRGGTQCTCHEQPFDVKSSQSPNFTTHCTCQCCSCVHQQPKIQETSLKLFKSNSCSTLPSVLSHQSRPQLTQFPPRTLRRNCPPEECSPKSCLQAELSPVQKTSSCSNLLERTSADSPVPVYNDNMIQAYARMASVIPEDNRSSSSHGGRRAQTLGRLRYTVVDNVYDPCPQPITSPNSNVSSFRVKNLSTVDDSRLPTDNSDCSPYRATHKKTVASVHDAGIQRANTPEIYSQIRDSGTCKPQEELAQSRTSLYQRHRNVGIVVPNCGPNPVYLKSALKKPTQSAFLQVNDYATVGAAITKPPEVEYAVVDKSKKNRFVSLPALNGTHNPPEIEEKDPPIPPKKMLHKSDFSLYRGRSSLLERMQEMTRNARSALQKAFSTERIYRPEKEERMDGLQRSRSFIKGITGSFRRRRKKTRASVPEVVPQASPNPEWDEHPSGPNTPVHVRGQLLQLNIDGSQVIELTKPPNKPYGFFVARGRVRSSKGVFVSRMRDQETQKHLAGLLDIGDEILEIDGSNVKDADIMEVNRLMANNTLLLTVLPYMCRKDL